MATLIRPANLNLDRVQLIHSLRRWLSPDSDDRRYDWLYQNSPHGKAQVWLATTEDGSLIGAAAAFPRRVFLGDGTATACVLGDFFVAPRFRAIGPALRLQKACLAGANPGCSPLFYDFPAAAMLPVYRRLSIQPSDLLVRFAKPLRVDRKVNFFVKPRFLASAVAALGNRLLKFQDNRRSIESDCVVSTFEAECGEEFTTLARAIGSRNGVCTERSAAYLNWRYRGHFSRRYEILAARRGGSLIAYLVFSQDGESADIADLFGMHEPPVLRDLIRAATIQLRARRIATINTHMLASHPWTALFVQMGFREREACPVIISQPSPGDGASSAPAWFLMQGDRES